MLVRRFGDSLGRAQAAVRFFPSHPLCATAGEGARARARDLFGRVRDDVARTGYRLYENAAEKVMAFLLSRRGCLDLAAVESSEPRGRAPSYSSEARNDTPLLR